MEDGEKHEEKEEVAALSHEEDGAQAQRRALTLEETEEERLERFVVPAPRREGDNEEQEPQQQLDAIRQSERQNEPCNRWPLFASCDNRRKRPDSFGARPFRRVG